VGVARRRSFPRVLERELLRRGLDIRVVVRGVPGARLERLAREVSRMPGPEFLSLDVAVVEGGINDAMVRMPVDSVGAQARRVMASLAERVARGCIAVLRVGPPPSLPEDYVESYDSVLATVANLQEAVYVPDLLKGVAGVDEYNLYDGLHPNQRGHQRVAETVLPFLLSIFADRPRCTPLGDRPR
jgi:acyl-CoA thioesterase-1